MNTYVTSNTDISIGISDLGCIKMSVVCSNKRLLKFQHTHVVNVRKTTNSCLVIMNVRGEFSKDATCLYENFRTLFELVIVEN